MHEEKNHQQHLAKGDYKRRDCIERAEVNEGDPRGQKR
jgi:hypothetical protein